MATAAFTDPRVLTWGAHPRGTVGDVFAEVSRRLHRVVPHDASVWLATDPATGLPTAPTRSEHMGGVCGGDARACLRVWELEFMVHDVNLYRDLARARTPAAALRQATADRPTRSPRYRELLEPNGFGDELRAVMRIDGNPWVFGGLFRRHGAPAFTPAETTLVAGMSAPVAATVREHARAATPPGAGDRDPGPGLLVFDDAGELVSVNDDARSWLDEFPPDVGDAGGFGVRLPMVAVGALMRARAIAAHRDHGMARARLRSHRSGRWLVCHASCLRRSDGSVGDTALVIEPAQASEIAPIVAQAHRLSVREQQITQRIARGQGTAEIAARLHLSTHTVRDHIKAIFEKVGVSSRGALVARIFAGHYAPVHLEPGAHDRIA
ncbi:MAG: helix-turn-helix transcriptional regulator [Thermoleophilia bacterium]|nr:helix-turn-helix transcriptional regulator [Thermoleophilia bacterium]